MGSVPNIGGGVIGGDRPGAQAEMRAWRRARRVPSVPLRVRVPGAVGVCEVSGDRLAIHDRSMRAGVCMASGTGGNRSGTAPVAGLIMAAPIARCQARGDHDPRPPRMVLPMTGNGTDPGASSRPWRATADSRPPVPG